MLPTWLSLRMRDASFGSELPEDQLGSDPVSLLYDRFLQA